MNDLLRDHYSALGLDMSDTFWTCDRCGESVQGDLAECPYCDENGNPLPYEDETAEGDHRDPADVIQGRTAAIISRATATSAQRRAVTA